MQLQRLTRTWAELAATRSRNAKRDLIAGVLAEATSADVEIVVSYLGGSLRQRRTGLGWKAMAELPPPVAAPSLDVVEVDEAFDRMSRESGPGSARRRGDAATALFARATEQEQGFLRGLVFSDLRQGALDAVVQDALAVAYGVPAATVRRAAMLLSSTTAAAKLLLAEGPEALDAVGLQVGIPVQPMLASPAPDAEAAIERSGLPALADVKLDGIRIQVHRDGDQVHAYTRSLEEITARLPEVVEVVRGLPAQRLVLDGEVIALRADGRPEAFQVIASRTASSVDPTAAARTPVRVYFFDVLHVDGRDLLESPLSERDAVLRTVVPEFARVPRVEVGSAAELDAVFTRAVADGYEGVVVKRLASPYAAGRREASWVKIKPRHTFDLVVTAIEWGSGRRQGWLSNLHLAAREPATGELIMLGKTFKGLTDELLVWQTEHFLRLEQRRAGHVVHVEPSTVVEIACDGLQISSRYPGGVALRFARVLRYREDKTASEADTIETVKALLGPPSNP